MLATLSTNDPPLRSWPLSLLEVYIFGHLPSAALAPSLGNPWNGEGGRCDPEDARVLCAVGSPTNLIVVDIHRVHDSLFWLILVDTDEI